MKLIVQSLAFDQFEGFFGKVSMPKVNLFWIYLPYVEFNGIQIPLFWVANSHVMEFMYSSSKHYQFQSKVIPHHERIELKPTVTSFGVKRFFVAFLNKFGWYASLVNMTVFPIRKKCFQISDDKSERPNVTWIRMCTFLNFFV